MKVLKPSSIQASRRSLKPTIIGNQLWPISCAVTQNSTLARRVDAVERRCPDIPCPPPGPATLIAAGHGIGVPLAE